MSRAGTTASARAFLGRRSRCRAGGDVSMGNTAPESTVPRAASGDGGADAGEGRA